MPIRFEGQCLPPIAQYDQVTSSSTHTDDVSGDENEEDNEDDNESSRGNEEVIFESDDESDVDFL